MVRGPGSDRARGRESDGARSLGPAGARGTGSDAAQSTQPNTAQGTGPDTARGTGPDTAQRAEPDTAQRTEPHATPGPGLHQTPSTTPDQARIPTPNQARIPTLDQARILGLMREYGRPIRYSYTERDQPLSVYQTVFALPSGDGLGSAEMPSAARPFTVGMVTELVSRGVQFAPVTLHTGVASVEAHEPPYPERFAVPEASARLINAVKAGPGRVVAVGTTAVRAVESAVDADGVVRAREGWTDLVVTPERGVRVVDGLLTGLHEPEASHLLMLEAVAGRAAIDRGYEAALRGLYLWHEFGDVHLVLPADQPHSEHCSSNCW
ncbi:S-adenosylmethionine:tRNA ribosyltransferase-isomerase [Streptomyces ferrugineus]|uniref:S-adenosylmethionine:tRNA ribosyltransferase-isomerase n=1 Tax=Streptomyces ferrugineus TaxID=1413221 RepID=UPI00389B22CE